MHFFLVVSVFWFGFYFYLLISSLRRILTIPSMHEFEATLHQGFTSRRPGRASGRLGVAAFGAQIGRPKRLQKGRKSWGFC